MKFNIHFVGHTTVVEQRSTDIQFMNAFDACHLSHELSENKQHTNVNNVQLVGALCTNYHNTNSTNAILAQSSNEYDLTTLRSSNDTPTTVYSEYDGNYCSTVHELELPVIVNDVFEQSNTDYIGAEFVDENEAIDCIDLDVTTEREQCNVEQTEQCRVAAKFSELNCRDKIFRSNVDTGFDMSDFGISDRLLSQDPQSKFSKLCQKIRKDVKELALMCAATDKAKLINILIINQQLNAIDPLNEPVEKPAEVSMEPRSIKTILVPPTMPQRVKPKTKRNIKVGYGVATADEVLDHLAEREILDGQLEIEQEGNEIEKKAREKEIEDVDKQLQEIRKLLTTLRSENAANVKEAAQQKKTKKRGSGNNASLLDDIILKNKTEIDNNNEELKILREKLKSLKADHILANKAAAAKRKRDIEMKKERGNVVIPQPASTSPN